MDKWSLPSWREVFLNVDIWPFIRRFLPSSYLISCVCKELWSHIWLLCKELCFDSLPDASDPMFSKYVTRSPKIQTIRLFYVRGVTNEVFAPLLAIPSLTNLDVSFCDITSPALFHLQTLTNLKFLSFESCHQIGDDGVFYLRKLFPLQHLCLSGTDTTDKGLKYLRNLRNLQTLGLDRCRISSVGLAHLGSLLKLREIDVKFCSRLDDKALFCFQPFQQLETLELFNCYKIAQSGFLYLCPLVSLRTLKLQYCPIGPEGIQKIFEQLTDLTCLHLRETKIDESCLKHLIHLTQLRRLNLNDLDISDAGLAGLVPLEQLEKLSLRSNENIMGAGLVFLEHLTKLTCLALSQPQFSGEGLTNIPTTLRTLKIDRNKALSDFGLRNIQHLTNLQTLTLSQGGEIGDAALISVRYLSKLTSLELDETKITNDGLVHISNLSQLSLVNLGSCKIDSNGLYHLKALTKLEQIRLSSTKVTNSGLVHISGLTRLRKIYLSGCTGVDGPGLMHFSGFTNLKKLDLSNCGTIYNQDHFLPLQGLLYLKWLTVNDGVKVHRSELEALVLGGSIVLPFCSYWPNLRGSQK